MYEPKMSLTPEQLDILHGKQGESKAKIMESIVRFGDIFDAPRLVKVTHSEGHLVTSFGISMLKPLFAMMDQLVADKVAVEGKFTMDPRPVDYKNVKCNLLDRLIFSKVLYSQQARYEKQLASVGLKNKNAFTCTCYLDEVGNIPRYGDILSWAESSAVVYANSVLGARCNRNSGIIELFGSIIGYVPEFGFLLDEGRKAKWRVIVKTSKIPEAQILGSAIGMKVMEGVPYVIGLDRWIGDELSPTAKSYLKDFGAATASNGAVGLFHIDNLTPEAKKFGDKLIESDAKEYIVDDAELERVYRSYPIMWKDKEKKGARAFIGCPHLTFAQLNEWSENILDGLRAMGRKKVTKIVVFTAAPDVAEEFRKTENYKRIYEAGIRVSSICPLMYMSNPLAKKRRIMTNSNKLRTYSTARYYKDQDLLDILVGKKVG